MNDYIGIDNTLNVLPNIGMYKGDFKVLEIDVENEYNRPISISSTSVSLKICDIENEEIVYFEKTGVLDQEKENVSNIQLLSEDTENLPISKYVYVIEIRYDIGTRNIGKGYLTIF